MSATTTTETEPQYEYYFRDNTFTNRRPILTGTSALPTFSTIPVIDISQTFSSSYPERLALAQELAEVCKTVGFFYIKGHGISQSLVDRVFEMSKKYHAQDAENKMEQYVYKSEGLRGYDVHYWKGREGVKKQSFLYSYDPALDPTPPQLTPAKREQCVGIHNLFPSQIQLPGFASTAKEYFTELLKLARSLMRMFALGLGAKENYFDELVTAPYVSVIFQHYAPEKVGEEAENGRREVEDGLGAHCDFETFTILSQDMVGGLEILNKNGVYIPAPPIRGTFVVNIGDFLQRISNDIFVSTVHRVRNTSGKERYSVPFFMGFNVDRDVEVMESCVSEDRPKRYGSRNLHEYTAMRRKLQKEAHEKGGGMEDALVMKPDM